jgi:hypothetical protein
VNETHVGHRYGTLQRNTGTENINFKKQGLQATNLPGNRKLAAGNNDVNAHGSAEGTE